MRSNASFRLERVPENRETTSAGIITTEFLPVPDKRKTNKVVKRRQISRSNSDDRRLKFNSHIKNITRKSAGVCCIRFWIGNLRFHLLLAHSWPRTLERRGPLIHHDHATETSQRYPDNRTENRHRHILLNRSRVECLRDTNRMQSKSTRSIATQTYTRAGTLTRSLSSRPVENPSRPCKSGPQF